MERRSSLKQWLPNGKLLLLSLTKCYGVPVLTTVKNYNKGLAKLQDFFLKTEIKTKTNQDQDQDQDQDFHFCPRGASRPKP